jgi:tetratricopeptide (TPR) repeat protein
VSGTQLPIDITLRGHREAEQAFLEGDHAACAAAIAPLVAKEASSDKLGFADATFLASRLIDLGRHGEALPIVERLLKADPETSLLPVLKAEILFRRRDWDGVVAAASEGLGLVYFNPRLHLILGLALARLGERTDAINELHVALRQNPALVPAYAALERLHQHDPLRALEYRRQAQSLRERLRRQRQSGRRSCRRSRTLACTTATTAPSARSGWRAGCT